MRLNWQGSQDLQGQLRRLRRLDWRLVAGILAVMALVAGLIWYGGYRPGISATSLWLGGVVASAALIAVLLSMSRSYWNIVGFVGLGAAFAALFIRSQLRRGALAPPVEEWTIAVGLVGGLVAVGLIFLRRRSRDSHDTSPAGATAVFSTVLTVFVLGAACLCVPVTKFIGDASSGGEGLLRSAPIRSEMLPLPADTELVPTEPFKMGGQDQHVFVIASTITIARATLVEQIRVHYIEQDWPLEPRQIGLRRVYSGCRPVRGLITWNPHCMEIIVDDGTDDRPGHPAVPGAVNVYIE